MTEPSDRVGVILTQWGEPEGFHPGYRKDVARRTRGRAAQSPYEPGTASFVGDFPFRSSVGLIPFAVAFPVNGLERVHDSFGFWRRDGDTYVNVYDSTLRLPVSQVDVPVIPASESTHRTSRSAWGRSPYDDLDRYEDIVEISLPNGIPDIDEVVYLAALGDEDILFGNAEPRLSHTVTTVNDRATTDLAEWFGDRVVVCCGAYADAGELMAREDIVALDLVEAGVHRLVLARETTDSNTYANDFMTRGFIETALADRGHGGIEIAQVRQVGRTPEYNRALLKVIAPHLDAVPEGDELAVIYATYGLPFPGRDTGGPFSTPHPWAREVYHENAFLNYLSFQHFLQSEAGERIRLAFGRPGTDAQRRTDAYFGYAMSVPADFEEMPEPQRFRTVREQIDQARADGHRDVLVVLSHWIDDNRDTLLALRLLQGLPLSAPADIAAGKRWIDWSEDGCHVTLAAAFDAAADLFATGYSHRLRGGVEALGVLAVDTEVVATGPLSHTVGGQIDVTAGELAGVSVEVAPPPDPDAPWAFTATSYRVTDCAQDAMLSLWDDVPGYLASCRESLDSLTGDACSPAVTIGPYRTILNRPAVLTLPLHRAEPGTPNEPHVYLFDHAVNAWAPLTYVPGGRPPRVSAEAVEVDINVFGNYVAARR